MKIQGRIDPHHAVPCLLCEAEPGWTCGRPNGDDCARHEVRATTARALEWAAESGGYSDESGVGRDITVLLLREGLIVREDIGTVSVCFAYLATEKGRDALKGRLPERDMLKGKMTLRAADHYPPEQVLRSVREATRYEGDANG